MKRETNRPLGVAIEKPNGEGPCPLFSGDGTMAHEPLEDDRPPKSPQPTSKATTETTKPTSRSWLYKLATAPPELAVFGTFCLVVCLADQLTLYLGPKEWRNATVPYTGWAPGNIYLFCLFFTSSLVLMKDEPKAEIRRQARGLRRCIIASLFIIIFFGAQGYLTRSTETFGNPYLAVSDWQPVWTVAVPLAWALILVLFPRFRHEGEEDPAETRRGVCLRSAGG